MKKLITLIISVLVAAVFFAGCGGVYTPPIISGGGSQGSGSGTGQGGQQTDPPEDGYTFTVTLTEGGNPYSPKPGQEITARWSGDDGHNYEATFNMLGVATQSGMDGDFKVTLSNLPDNYTYNPNGIYANNNHRDVTVELLPIITPAGTSQGTNYDTDCIVLQQTGTYRVQLNDRDQIVYFEYSPPRHGKYFIESWVDVSANEINPKANYHVGTSAWHNPNYQEYDGGGASSSFTKNFRFVAENPEGYQNVFCLGIHADCVSSDLYPVTVDFTITYEGEASDPEGETVVIEANGPFLREYGGRYFDEEGSFHEFVEEVNGNLDDIAYIKNADGTVTDLIKRHDDGFYYVTDRDTGEESKIYVMLSKNTAYFKNYVAEDCTDAFLHNDYFHREWSQLDDGHLHTFPLRLGIGDYNYDEFYYKDYHEFMQAYTGYEPGDVNGPVYNDSKSHCNKDGAHPVNDELKTFLQEYAKHYLIFRDGFGNGEGIGINSSENFMWLFACGIYS